MKKTEYKFLIDSILEHLDEGIFVVDKDANVTFYNESATNIAGVSREMAVGKNILEIFPDLTPQNSTLYQVLKTKQPIINYVQTYRNYKGLNVSILTTAIPLITQGELVGALEIYQDLTLVKELLEKILRLQSELYSKKNNGNARKVTGAKYVLDDIIGESAAMRKLKELAQTIADSTSPVLIYGETGTGKELLVQAIHNASKTRGHKPFIAQNCAALPDTLLDSILFGTTTGSFTGAKDKPGLFELADGGTFFLDEINSMSIELQGKLLRVLQDGIIRRVGGADTAIVDVRIIASTNEPLLNLVERNLLRKDLYYRLNVVSLSIPALRERKEDIALLVGFFINCYNHKLGKRVRGICDEALDILKSYHWPGNVRELRFTIESIINFIDNKVIGVSDIPQHISSSVNAITDFEINLDEPGKNTQNYSLADRLNFYEKTLIQKAIKETNGNGAKAAKLLNIPRQTLHNKMKKHNIDWKIIF